MYDVYQNQLDKNLGMYVPSGSGIPAHATKKNWKLSRSNVTKIPASAVAGVKRDGFHLFTTKLQFEILIGDHPAARLSRTLSKTPPKKK